MPFNLVGKKLAHYEVLAPLGAGAMSEVYRCRDTRLDKQVAVKVIHESVASRSQLVERFEQEARAAARLEHPNVARVHYSGSQDGKAFYAMELVEGWSLAEFIEARISFTWDQYLGLFAQACAGLQAATDAGICHGDIKPANMLMAESGTLKLLDFGLARFSDDSTLGHAGTVMGTPFYMAPELVRGREGDHRTDLYSLGATFFHILTGKPPFDAETPVELLEKHACEAPPYLRDLGGNPPQALASLLGQLLAKASWDRPPSYREVHARLLQVRDAMPEDRRESALRWCGRDRMNSEASGENCSLCGQPYQKRESAESFHVDVVGWNNNDGERAVASFISDALGMDTQEVAPLLRPLPYRAAFRLPRDRAKKMHRRLFDLGADVSLTGVGEALSESRGSGEHRSSPPARITCPARWPPEPRLPERVENGRIDSVRMSNDSVQPEAEVDAGHRTQLVVLLSLVAVTLAVFSVNQHLLLSDLREQNEEWLESARATDEAEEQGRADMSDEGISSPEAGTGPEMAVEESAATPGEARLEGENGPSIKDQEAQFRSAAQPSLFFALSSDSDLQAGQLIAIGVQLDFAASVIAADLPIEPGTEVQVLQLATSKGNLRSQWRAASYAPVIELPLAGDADLSAEAIGPLLRYQLTRNALRLRGGPSVPAWLMEGIALFLESGAPGPAEISQLSELPAHPTALRAGEEPSAAGQIQLRSFAAHLAARHGWPALRAVLTELRNGVSSDEALRKVLGTDTNGLEKEWIATLDQQ